ncbi:outer membrane-specific lipoprotein transporter subunit LolC [Escherichia coli str. 'clone D i14']|nr:outer membrane-specific lipoprotein transporter subunit LolC [Escherichia coli str. 'clone D i2']AER88771.1 outer membrane-specific lipoprotein transporter subunit LolC [Escherichia coli str. 'clone D i14']
MPVLFRLALTITYSSDVYPSCFRLYTRVFATATRRISCTNLSLYLLACVTCVGVQRIASVVSSPGFLPSALPSG